MKEEELQEITHQEMQIVIDRAKSKGFIAIEDDSTYSIEDNYKSAVEFEKLTPDQQEELSKLAKELGL